MHEVAASDRSNGRDGCGEAGLARIVTGEECGLLGTADFYALLDPVT